MAVLSAGCFFCISCKNKYKGRWLVVEKIFVLVVDYEYHTYKDYGPSYDYYGSGYDQQEEYALYGPTAYSESVVRRGRGGRGVPAGMPRGIISLSACLYSLTFYSCH